jgi:hypothetical protein
MITGKGECTYVHTWFPVFDDMWEFLSRLETGLMQL